MSRTFSVKIIFFIFYFSDVLYVVVVKAQHVSDASLTQDSFVQGDVKILYGFYGYK